MADIKDDNITDIKEYKNKKNKPRLSKDLEALSAILDKLSSAIRQLSKEIN